MTIGKNILIFKADWACFCGSIIGIAIPLAVIQSEAGYESRCRHCHQWWRIRETGAEALDRTNGKEETNAEPIQDTGPFIVSLPGPDSLRLDANGGPRFGGSETPKPAEG